MSTKTTGSKPANTRPRSENTRKVLFESSEVKRDIAGENRTVLEKSVVRSEDKLFCKFFSQKTDMVHKVTVESKPTGGEYIVTITKGKRGELTPNKSTYDKKKLMEMLKADKNLEFMADYIGKDKSLARSGSKTKTTGSVAKKTGSVAKKTGSKAKKTGSKK
jgi:hypothetical protein